MTNQFKHIVYASLIAIMGYSAGSLFIVGGEPIELGLAFGFVMTMVALFVLVYPGAMRVFRWLQNRRAGETA